jgi:hypothetical protein
MLAVALSFLLAFSGNLPPKNNCGCVKAKPDEITRSGVNELITIIEHKPYKQIRGVVFDPRDITIPGAFVEVFTHPEHLLLSSPESEKAQAKQRRIAACLTEMNGKFCFPNLPAGKYELRIGKEDGWKITYFYLVVAPHNRKASGAQIKVHLQVGT